jgi:DNA-binding transcriptional LysR family regulator
MDIRQLKLFISVAQTLNFTQSAKQNYLTQPAVTHQINDLEKELGAQLFTRTKHKVFLTSAGEAFFDYAVRMIDLEQQSKSRIFNISQGKQGNIKICAVQSSVEALTQCLSVFSKRYPDIQVELDIGTGLKQLKAINSDSYDFYFSFVSLLQSIDTLDYLITDRDRFSLVVHKDDAPNIDVNNFLTLKKLNLISELHAEGPFLVDKVVDICRHRGLDIEHIDGFSSFLSVIISVNAGMGFTIFPNDMAESCYGKNIAIIPIPGDDAIIENAVGWNKNIKNIAAEKFMEISREVFLK